MKTLLVVLMFASVTLAAPVAAAQETAATDDSRAFLATGFRIDSNAVYDYFVQHGGVATFGYPISREFTLYGAPVQLFQRAALQTNPDGSVQAMNLLDRSLLPYTRIAGSTLPPVDQSLAMVMPSSNQPAFQARLAEFLRASVPETWRGQPVRFLSTLDLDVWGAPTSSPVADPANPGFIYQRFERGILQYDAACACTQGVALGDYLKAILTGTNVPADLEAEAAQSPLLRQYDPSRVYALARPEALPLTDLTDAFLPSELL